MAKETIVKENPVTDALRKLKEEELELTAKLKPVQEAIAALEKILDKSSKKAKPAKESASESPVAEEAAEEVGELEKAE
jgi:tetrahydromethanopterin S-methyltransferase subunit B